MVLISRSEIRPLPTLKVEALKQWQYLAMGWMVQRSNPGGCKTFRTCSDLPWDPPRLLYNRYQAFPGVKRLGCGTDHPPPSSADVNERVELYFYTTSGSSWLHLGWTLPYWSNSVVQHARGITILKQYASHPAAPQRVFVPIWSGHKWDYTVLMGTYRHVHRTVKTYY